MTADVLRRLEAEADRLTSHLPRLQAVAQAEVAEARRRASRPRPDG